MSEGNHTTGTTPPPALVERPDRKATVRLLAPWAEATHLHDCAASDAQIDALIAACSALAEQLGERDAENDHLRAMLANLRRRNDRLQLDHDAGLAARGALLDRAIRRITQGRE